MCNLTMAKTMDLIVLLFDITSAWKMIFAIPLYIQCIVHARMFWMKPSQSIAYYYYCIESMLNTLNKWKFLGFHSTSVCDISTMTVIQG